MITVQWTDRDEKRSELVVSIYDTTSRSVTRTDSEVVATCITTQGRNKIMSNMPIDKTIMDKEIFRKNVLEYFTNKKK